MAYGLTYVKSLSGNTEGALQRVIVTNSETIHKGDPVTITAGYATLCTGDTTAMFGVAQEEVLGDGTKTIEVICDPQAVYKITADNVSTTTAQAHMGTYHNFTGATGAVLLDSDSTSTAGTLLALKLDGTTVTVVPAKKQIKL